MPRPSAEPLWVQSLDRSHLLTPLRVLAILVAAILATVVTRHLVARTLARALTRATAADEPRAEVRQKALGSALRAALVGVIWSVAVITVISEVGVNIGAFVATATVVGGAVAFGAQTLIRDVIAGFFVLADDQYGVGDEVDLGLTSGTVEQVTLRSARLRDAQGRVWHVPHGNVQRVANLSKSVTAVLDVQVARTMPVDAALAEVAGVAAAFADDEHVAPLLLATPIVLGVVDGADDRITVRVTVPCRIGRRDEAGRRWRLAVERAFESRVLVAPFVAPMVLVAGGPADGGGSPERDPEPKGSRNDE